MSMPPRAVTSIEQLEELYSAPVATSIRKVTATITPLQARYIEASPFVLVSTVGAEGVDCSPRGDPPGFLRVTDSSTILLPDRRGNNRLDSLRNIITDGRISLLVLVPGINVTLRLIGTARLLVDPDLLESFTMQGKVPATVIEISVTEVYTQCPKALIRSSLWDSTGHQTHDTIPTVGQIMSEITAGEFDGDAYDKAYPERVRQTIY